MGKVHLLNQCNCMCLCASVLYLFLCWTGLLWAVGNRGPMGRKEMFSWSHTESDMPALYHLGMSSQQRKCRPRGQRPLRAGDLSLEVIREEAKPQHWAVLLRGSSQREKSIQNRVSKHDVCCVRYLELIRKLSAKRRLGRHIISESLMGENRISRASW